MPRGLVLAISEEAHLAETRPYNIANRAIDRGIVFDHAEMTVRCYATFGNVRISSFPLRDIDVDHPRNPAAQLTPHRRRHRFRRHVRPAKSRVIHFVLEMKTGRCDGDGST